MQSATKKRCKITSFFWNTQLFFQKNIINFRLFAIGTLGKRSIA